jgi:hypothetical protein
VATWQRDKDEQTPMREIHHTVEEIHLKVGKLYNGDPFDIAFVREKADFVKDHLQAVISFKRSPKLTKSIDNPTDQATPSAAAAKVKSKRPINVQTCRSTVQDVKDVTSALNDKQVFKASSGTLSFDVDQVSKKVMGDSVYKKGLLEPEKRIKKRQLDDDDDIGATVTVTSSSSAVPTEGVRGVGLVELGRDPKTTAYDRERGKMRNIALQPLPKKFRPVPAATTDASPPPRLKRVQFRDQTGGDLYTLHRIYPPSPET